MSEPRGEALVRALERRFVTATDEITLGGYAFAVTRPYNAEALISQEDFARDERLPYWADVWPSALVLAERLLEEESGGRTLLELGCGVGLVTLAALRAGFDVLATDYYEDALRFTRANAWRTLGREPRTRLVDWRHLPPDLGTFDRAVAADVLYERPYGALVAEVLARALAPRGWATVADPGRVAAEAFLDECHPRGLEVVSRQTRRYEAGAIRQRIAIYEIRRAPRAREG